MVALPFLFLNIITNIFTTPMYIYINDIELSISVSPSNVHIENSFEVKSKTDMYYIIKHIKEKYPEHNINKLSDFILVQEWASHNLCYIFNIYRNRTKDVDLNYTNKWYLKIPYVCIGCFYNLFLFIKTLF